MRVLFLVPHPPEGASGRQRVLQYLPWLAQHGIRAEVRPFMSQTLYRILYRPGRVPSKVAMTSVALAKRLGDLVRAARADVVVVHREALPLGTALIERLMARLAPALVFDFDDAIYLPHAGRANSWTRLFRNAEKTAAIARVSAHVIAGNQTLAAYAQRYNAHVSVIPTPVDTDRFACAPPRAPSPAVVIGWIGSHSTARYLASLAGPLEALSRRYPQLRIRVVGDGPNPLRLPNAEMIPWALEREPDELHRFDIGLMPMPDDDWARGKCGFKALLYMSVGIPVAASPVGVNQEIVRDGVNGWLCRAESEWFERLSQLIEDRGLRRRLGQAGRAIVEQEYSLRVQAPRLLHVLQQAGRNGRSV